MSDKPTILISAFADTREWVEGLRLGAADYTTKPFRSEELLARVKTHLSQGRAHISLAQQAAALGHSNEQLRPEIAGQHGGRIWVTSQPGQGATFHFTLPKSPRTSANKENAP